MSTGQGQCEASTRPHTGPPGGLPAGLGPGDPSSQGVLPGAVVTPAAGTRCVVTLDSVDALPAGERSGQPGLCGRSSREDGVGVAWGPALLGPADSRADSDAREAAPSPAEPSSPTALQKGAARKMSQG